MMEQTNNSTETLLASFQAGNMAAFSELYDSHINILFNYGLKLTIDKELLKDCIHDIFVKLYVKKDKLCDELRKRMYMSDTAVEEINVVSSTDVEDDYMEEEKTRNNLLLVNNLMDQLSPRQREALTLYYIEEKKYEDICEIMDMNYQSVRNLMHRGLTKLRALVG